MSRGKYTIEHWRAVRKALSEGKSIRAVASQTGVNRGAVYKWSHMNTPPDWMWLEMDIDKVTACASCKRIPKSRLTYEDRVIIFAMRNEGATLQQIADVIGCHRTTVGRELARSQDGPYDPRSAHLLSVKSARRPKVRKLDANPILRAYVINALMLNWSPQQISERIVEEFPGDMTMRISHETIYQTLYLQGKGQLRHELGVQIALRSGRKGRKPRSKLPARSSRPWVEGREISLRPPEAKDRAIPGHWEGDLIIGGDASSCLITLIERRSRFLLMRRLCVHDAETVEEKLEEMVRDLPEELTKTLTWDQGSEMAKASQFELATNFKVYFCDPHSPWQRPTNENVNGLIREYFPKGTKFSKVTDEEVSRAQWLLNNRPRGVLNWKFPAEVMQEVLAEGAMIA